MTSKKKKPRVKILTDGYYEKDKPIEPGSVVTVTKSDAAKLIARGIAEESK